MKQVVSICLYSHVNPCNVLLSVKLNTEQSVEECQDILMNLFPQLRQKLSEPSKRQYNDDVNF